MHFMFVQCATYIAVFRMSVMAGAISLWDGYAWQLSLCV